MYYIPLFVVLFFIIILSFLNFGTNGFTNYIAPYGSNSQKQWWTRQGWERFGYPYYSYWENFENPAAVGKNNKAQEEESNKIKLANEEKLISFPPDSPAPADLSMRAPYHLLEDTMKPPRVTESISCVNSRSCYATDFNAAIEKTGNFRQLTNNYKRGYPDSCSSPFQELVLNFYKVKDIF